MFDNILMYVQQVSQNIHGRKCHVITTVLCAKFQFMSQVRI